jgi:hypothetical protein
MSNRARQLPTAARACRPRRESRHRHLEASRTRARNYARSERGHASSRQARARWRAANPEKVAAHQALRAAVKRGEIERAVACEVVGCDRTGRLHGHHHNCESWRNVIFLCGLHDEAAHDAGPLGNSSASPVTISRTYGGASMPPRTRQMIVCVAGGLNHFERRLARCGADGAGGTRRLV